MIPPEIFYMRPPEKTGTYIVQSSDNAGAATAFDWTSALSTDLPKGTVIVYLEAYVKDIYVRFGPTSTTATTAKNGVLLKADSPGHYFHIDPVNHKYIDHYAAASGGSLKIQVASAVAYRGKQ